MKNRALRLGALGIAQAVSAGGCATNPRISVESPCEPSASSAIAVRTVDTKGNVIPYLTVLARTIDGSQRSNTRTSSLGNARLSLSPGRYRVTIGDGAFRWQGARKYVVVRPSCTLALKATLVPYEINPRWRP
jgi:hypothetical protein